MNVYRLLSGLLLLCLLTTTCNPDEPGIDPGGEIADPVYGAVYFNFAMPELRIRENSIHRVDLSLALTMDSLYKKKYCAQANVSDYKVNYSFQLLPGRYFYQAGITCSRQGDTCLFAGFPGGCYSIWWTSGWVDVEAGKTTEKNLHFQ